MREATEEKEALLESLRPVTDPIPDSPHRLGKLKNSRVPTAKFLTKKLDWVITTLIVSRSDRQEYLHCLAIFSKGSEKYYKGTESFVFQKLSRYSSPLIEDGGFFKISEPKAQWKGHSCSNLARNIHPVDVTHPQFKHIYFFCKTTIVIKVILPF